MSPPSHMVKCACCGDDVEETLTGKDPDTEGPVCLAYCKNALQWAHAHLRRKTSNGVSITGIHGPREKPLPWDSKLAEREYQQWLDSQGEDKDS